MLMLVRIPASHGVEYDSGGSAMGKCCAFRSASSQSVLSYRDPIRRAIIATAPGGCADIDQGCVRCLGSTEVLG
ncbi:hypothetical protein BM1_05232 [Bipolaris maydis]|nr:hypothetical protein BM1_05232 [Bipolaris maydis]